MSQDLFLVMQNFTKSQEKSLILMPQTILTWSEVISDFEIASAGASICKARDRKANIMPCIKILQIFGLIFLHKGSRSMSRIAIVSMIMGGGGMIISLHVHLIRRVFKLVSKSIHSGVIYLTGFVS